MVQALEGLNRLSKGLTLNLCTKQRPAVGERLAAPLQAAMRTVQVGFLVTLGPFPHVGDARSICMM